MKTEEPCSTGEGKGGQLTLTAGGILLPGYAWVQIPTQRIVTR